MMGAFRYGHGMRTRVLFAAVFVLLLGGCSVPAPVVETVAVPDVVGASLDEAHAELEGLGFVVTSESSDGSIILRRSNWTVVAQTPAGGSEAAAGSSIALEADKPAEGVDGTPYVEAVKSNWGECIAALGLGELVFAPGGDGTQQVGFVTGIAEGVIVTWSVGDGNGGAIFTLPVDVASTEALATVGC